MKLCHQTKIVLCGFILLAGCAFRKEEMIGSSLGAENKPTASASVPDVNPAEPKGFKWIELNVFIPKCNDCHSGAGAGAGIDLTSYDNAMKKKRVIVKGKPEDSMLMVAVDPSDGTMPPNPPKLSKDDVDVIHDWILNGAQNN